MDLLPCYLAYAYYCTLSGFMLRSAINRTRERSIFITCDQCNPQHIRLRIHSLWHLTLQLQTQTVKLARGCSFYLDSRESYSYITS